MGFYRILLLIMKDSIVWERNKGMVKWSFKTEIFIKDNSKTICSRVKVFILGLTDKTMMVILDKAWSMAGEGTISKMEIAMWDNISTTNAMEEGHTDGRTAQNTKEILWMTKSNNFLIQVWLGKAWISERRFSVWWMEIRLNCLRHI